MRPLNEEELRDLGESDSGGLSWAQVGYASSRNSFKAFSENIAGERRKTT